MIDLHMQSRYSEDGEYTPSEWLPRSRYGNDETIRESPFQSDFQRYTSFPFPKIWIKVFK